MMSASVEELTRIKALIVSDTQFYAGKKTNKALGIPNDRWDKELPDTFLKLAEDNYEHFSPGHVAMGAAVYIPGFDNEGFWRKYHKRAIEEAQEQSLRAGNASVFYEWPLIINAFGDHFLTDAFAAGHLINKGVMMERLKTNFYDNHTMDLNDAGEDFFRRVAAKAWRGAVKEKFSQLEQADPYVDIPVIGGVGHPNIDSESRFGKFLIKAANDERDKVSNLFVKALHDHLNDNGVEVSNEAGDGAWFLPGDGSLMVGTGRLTPANLKKNFDIIRKAVQQSVDNVNNAPRASIMDYEPFFAKVWQYAPVLTSAGQKEITKLISDYSDPHSQTLVDAAVAVIDHELDAIINLVVNKLHKLRPR
jgi:hypothetical protein